MGPYCRFCDTRCFLVRVVPADDQAVPGMIGWTGLMATCPAGMAHDRANTGHDHTTAINPYRCTACGKLDDDHPGAECCPDCACRAARAAAASSRPINRALAGLPAGPATVHTCTVCFQPVDQHNSQCDHADAEHDGHLPALCCPGCGCGSFEAAHPEMAGATGE